ncbi:MAG: penicillin-binding protein [Actinobacteria bacterium]|nr:penicillin-binding protein [Actinomycetota bacterium]
MSAKNALITAAVAVLAIAGAGGAYFYTQNQAKPDAAARAYLEAWEDGDYEFMEDISLSEPARLAELYESIPEDMGATEYSFELDEVTEDGDLADAAFTATWALEELGEFTYRSELELERHEERWRVVWAPTTIHPDFDYDARFRRTRSWPERGRILALDGQPITEYRDVVVVGIEPQRITDRDAMIQALVDNLEVDPAEVNAALDRPGLREDWFLPVVEIPADRFEELRPIIYPVPGLVFQSKQDRQPPSEEFARHVIGSVGEITAEGLENRGEIYRRGDLVGRTGLEQVFEGRLAGRPTLELRITYPEADDEVLVSDEGQPSEDLATTLSVPIQQAAEAALEGIEQPAAVVVVDSTSFDVRAAVSRPLGEFNRAFGGRYPPGSSFKVVFSATLMDSGVTVDQQVPCPAETEVGGRAFRNFEGEALGVTTFRQVFVHSCNTGFIELGSAVESEQLIEGAKRFGFGENFDFPLNVAKAVFPQPNDVTEKAAATIGQGRVLASPLHMATVAAAIAADGWQPPKLLTEAEASERKALDPATGQTLRELMVQVVAEGTGRAAQVPGVEVGGKTGTAEFGDETPPKTHAWFIGFTDDLAFAILVEDGGVGGRVAAPIAAKLIAALE